MKDGAEIHQDSICQSCGMCCDGTLFKDVDVDATGPDPSWPDDVIKLVSKDNAMSHPCPAHQSGSCVVYHNRPIKCREFSCILLTQLNAGEIERQDALLVIQETLSLKTTFVEAVVKVMEAQNIASPKKLFFEFRTKFKDTFETKTFRKTHATIFLTHARLMHELKTRFHDWEKNS